MTTPPVTPRSSQKPDSFEHLIAGVSACFLQSDADAIDSEIERAFAALGNWMEVDRCFTFLISEDGREHRVRHIWTAPGIAPDPEVIGQDMRRAFPWVGAMMRLHEDVVVERLEDIPTEGAREVAYCRDRGIQSFLMCPMVSGKTIVGNIGIDSIRRERHWTDADRTRIRLLGEVIANAVLRQQKDREIARLKIRLEAENAYLREEIEVRHRHEEIIGNSAAMKSMLAQLEQVATTDANVLVLGETGTGKELLARAIHRLSKRHGKPMVAVNCGALSPTLIESELFGREKGAYTGAISRQIGRFESADGSTLFLDEIGELPLELQTKLLRVLQSGEFERLGNPRTLKVDLRLVAATHRDLEAAVHQGHFREDLYYRLNVFPIRVPPLRERADDIPLLVWAFVREFEQAMGRRIEQISCGDMDALSRYPWPGNVRELRNVIERSLILSNGPRLRVARPTESGVVGGSGSDRDSGQTLDTLAEVEREHIHRVLERSGWRVRGEHGAAVILGLKPTTLESRMQKLGIQRPKA